MTTFSHVGALVFAVLLAGFSRSVSAQDLTEDKSRYEKNLIQALAEKSDLVVVAEVAATRSQWYGRSIVTVAEVKPLSVMKGRPPGDTFPVLVFGGTVGVINQEFTHEPVLRVGEVAVLFLSAPRDEASRKYQSFRIVDEDGKIPLLNPGESKNRLTDNQRLARLLADLTSAISGGR